MVAATATTPRDHYAIALQWQADVIAGRVRVGRLFRAAVERHINDLTRQGQPDFPYTFVPNEGSRVCRWVELFRHIKGPLAGRLIRLDPWQLWILVVGFGWRKGAHRRFRRFSWWLCRGQGKSILAALLALYILNEGQGAEVSPAATTREQARIVFDVARHALNNSPELRDRLGFSVEQHRIRVEHTASEMKPVSSESGSNEGANSSCVVLDELHAHPNRDLHDTLLTGCGKRPGSLMIDISTAPTNTASIGYEVWDISRKILTGALRDDTEFAVIVQADEGQDPYAWETIAQANPGLGVSVDRDYMAMVKEKARQQPSQRPAYFSRHLGWVITASTPYIDLDKWDACADPTLRLEDFAGEECWIGLDLASKVDLASAGFVFTRTPEGEDKPHYYVFVRNYINEAAVNESRTAQYPGWAAEGHLIVTPGDVTDFGRIEADLAGHSTYLVKELAADPWQAQYLLQRLAEKGFTTVEFRPIYANLSEPTKTLEELVLQRRLHHNGDPVLKWALSNVVLKRDGKDNVAPGKERPENKIDPVLALITALARALAGQTQQSGYGTRGLRVLGLEDDAPEYGPQPVDADGDDSDSTTDDFDE